MRSKGSRRRICPLPRSGGGGLYLQSLHKNAPAAPYKRRLIPLREAVALAFRAGGLRRVGVLGRSPKRILVPFVRTKGTPRRRAVQAVTSR